MDEENFIWTAPEDVPAEIQIDGEVTETYTGEQVADEAGNPAWWDDNYPGQITDTAANPTQDAYGLNILNAEQTAQLTRNINPAFINNFTDPNTPASNAATNAVNKSATNLNPGRSNLAGPPDTFIKDANGNWVVNPKYPINTSATPVSVYVDSNGVAFNPVTGLSYPVNSQGRQLLPANVALTPDQQIRINQFNHTPTNLAPTAVADPEVGPRTETRQTAEFAAAKNAYSETPNPYLTNIEQAGANIDKDTKKIALAKQYIETQKQNIVNGESIIAQNNSELANPDISAARRAELEANNAKNAQIIEENKQAIDFNQQLQANAQNNIEVNNVVINENAAVYRDSTGPSNTTVVPINVDPNVTATTTAATAVAAVSNPTIAAAAVNANTAGIATTTATTATAPFFGANPDAEQEAASAAEVGRQLAQRQQVVATQRRIPNNSDWRVRLQLAPNAQYLYNAPQPGILWPLRQTGGVIFPYTPRIEIGYKADYESYALTHSNYKGYFYKSSYADAVNMTASFTAQDTTEAQYLLAVIHFFRSVTKMFYGQDTTDFRGAPPPLVYLTGLGEFQFSQHPCVVSSFNYNLPSDVDYIRARSINVNGTDLLTRRSRQDLPTNPISGAVARLQNLFSSQGINKGALFYPPGPPTLGENQPTYVPTKLEISLTLLPVQTRNQVSKQFSVKEYANGNLLRGGFW